MDYIDDLIATVRAANTHLRRVADADAARRPAPGKWSAKEVIGHLIDSADRSADQRGGCGATFLIDALVTPESALEMARATYPRVFARIEQHLGHAVKLVGPAEEFVAC